MYRRGRRDFDNLWNRNKKVLSILALLIITIFIVSLALLLWLSTEDVAFAFMRIYGIFAAPILFMIFLLWFADKFMAD